MNSNNMKEQNLPLVSVPVVTYNSVKTVLETLDSIYNQTYPNIELIVSDDCSTDNTIEICREWIETHKERFIRTELLTVEMNTGVSANSNRAEAACRGEWKKSIAGDDIMLPNCIQDCIDYVTEHPDTIWLFGKMKPFGCTRYDNMSADDFLDYSFFKKTSKEQLRFLMVVNNYVPAAAAFNNIPKNRKINVTNDERIPMMEDWPKWINLLRAGVKLHFIDKVIVKYRISEHSISNSSKPSQAYLESLAKMFLFYRFDAIWKEDKARAIIMYIDAKHTLSKSCFWKGLNMLSEIIYKLYAKIVKKH